MDKTSIEKLNQLHPSIRQDALNAYNEAVSATPKGVHPAVDEAYRSFEESDKDYLQGRTAPGEIISNAKGGQSYHNYGLGFDFYLLINGNKSWFVGVNWMIVVNIFKKHGFTWGGDFPGKFKDPPHLQKTMGYTWSKLLMKYNDKDFIPGTTYVKL